MNLIQSKDRQSDKHIEQDTSKNSNWAFSAYLNFFKSHGKIYPAQEQDIFLASIHGNDGDSDIVLGYIQWINIYRVRSPEGFFWAYPLDWAISSEKGDSERALTRSSTPPQHFHTP